VSDTGLSGVSRGEAGCYRHRLAAAKGSDTSARDERVAERVYAKGLAR